MKKFAVLLLAGILLFNFFATPALAETQTVEIEKRYDLPSAAELNTSKAACKDGICADNMMNFQLNALAGAASCVMGGLICGAETQAEQSYYIQRSVLGQTSQAVAYLYLQPPATTGEYLAWLGSRAGIVPKTYAQGVTFARLLPILPIWKAFRDIAFTLLAIIMVMIGLMIMFRAKANPQTVANVENTIPRVVVTIILIWLSFPIAALIIDFMYVIIAAGIGVIGTAVKDPNVSDAIKDYSTGGFMTLFGKTLAPAWQFGSPSAAVGGAGLGTVGAMAGLTTLSAFTGPAAIALWSLLALFGGGLTGLAPGGGASTSVDMGGFLLNMVSPILMLLILIVLLFSVFKIFFILLNAYIQILINILLAPVILLANAIPGRNTFGSWWKGIVANMLAFVVTALMLYLAWAIASLVHNQPFWTPPFIMQGAGVPQIVVGLISLGIVLLIPQVIKMVKDALGAKPMFNVGPSMIMAPVTGGVGQGLGLVSQFHTMSLGGQALGKLPVVGSAFKKIFGGS